MPACATIKRCCQLLLLLLIFSPAAAYAKNFEVSDAFVDHIGNGYVFNGHINYSLNSRVREALANGVPITFIQEFELIDSVPVLGKFWHWDTSLWTTELNYELRYHDLAQRYILQSLDTHHLQTFPTIKDALAAMGTIKKLSLPPKFTKKTAHLRFRVRSGLNLNALPTPMRPGALISDKWQLTSPWKQAVWR